MATTTSIGIARRSTSALGSLTLFTGWMLGSLAAALAAWVLIPTLFLGWTPLVVTSGSMEPSIGAGDVVLVDPGYGAPGPDSVVAFESGEGVTVHRVVAANPDGTLTTKGDANASPDSTAVRPDEVAGVGRLLVPHIGMLRTAGWVWVAAFSALLGVTLFLTPGGRYSMIPAVIILSLLAGSTGSAVFATTTSSAGSSARAVDLAPPTNVTAACGLLGSASVNVDLTWAPSSTSGVTGYRIYHDGPSTGADFTAVGTVGSGVTNFTHVVTSPLAILGTQTYLVTALSGNWESESSNTDAVVITQVLLANVCTPD